MRELETLKLRRLLSRYVTLLLAVSLVLLLAGGALVYTTQIAPGTETDEMPVTQWETNGNIVHSATVQNGTTVFPTGTVLAERSVYYTDIAPVLDIDLEYEFIAPNGELDVDGESTLVIRSVDEDGGELWRTDDRLESVETTLEPNEETVVTTSIDIPGVTRDVARIEDELGAAVGTVEVAVEYSITAESTIDDERAVHSQTYTVRIDPGVDTYTVETESTGDETHQRTEPVVTERNYGPVRTVSGPLLVLLGLLGAIGLAAGRYDGRLELSETERKNLEFAETREELDEWISRAQVEPRSDDDERIRAETLDDLVDIAIDTDERVIEDYERRSYYVLGENVYYTYTPDPAIDIDRFRS